MLSPRCARARIVARWSRSRSSLGSRSAREALRGKSSNGDTPKTTPVGVGATSRGSGSEEPDPHAPAVVLAPVLVLDAGVAARKPVGKSLDAPRIVPAQPIRPSAREQVDAGLAVPGDADAASTVTVEIDAGSLDGESRMQPTSHPRVPEPQVRRPNPNQTFNPFTRQPSSR